MSKLIHRKVLPLAGAALLSLLATLATAASSGEDVYRCRVLGWSSACAVLPAPVDESGMQVVPGSYARYLIHLGYPVERAIAEARTSGEEPTMQFVTHEVPRQLSGVEAHERYLGHGPALGAPREINVTNVR